MLLGVTSTQSMMTFASRVVLRRVGVGLLPELDQRLEHVLVRGQERLIRSPASSNAVWAFLVSNRSGASPRGIARPRGRPARRAGRWRPSLGPVSLAEPGGVACGLGLLALLVAVPAGLVRATRTYPHLITRPVSRTFTSANYTTLTDPLDAVLAMPAVY